MPTAGDPRLTGGAQLPLSHNPLQRISFNPNKPSIDPAALAAAQEQAIESFLELLDSQTGLDLLGFWRDYTTFSNQMSAALQQSWMNFQNFLNGLAQEADADVEGALQWVQQQFNQLSASLQQNWLNFQQLINSVVGGVDKDINDLITALNTTATDAATATANWDTVFLDLGFSVTDAAQLASFIGNTWSQLTITWNDFWNGIFGTSASGKTASDVQTAATSVSSTANTASTNASSALSQWVSAITASGQASATAFGNFVSSTWSSLTSTWNSIWNGTYGTSATGKTVSDVQTATAATVSTANTASTNASSALSQWLSAITAAGQANASAFGTFVSSTWSNLQTTWNNFWDGSYGTTGTTGKTATDIKTAAASTASTANTASTNASSALSQWVSAITASGQSTATAFGTFVSTTWSNLTSTWNSIWNGTYGTSATGKTATDVQTATAATASTANTAGTNASSALSQWTSALSAAGQATATALGTFVTNTWTQLGSTWNSFWNGTFGTSVSGKTASDVQTAAASVASTSNTASTNASSALSQWSAAITAAAQANASAFGTFVSNTFTQLGNTWNSIWNGTYGTSATGKTAADAQTATAATASTSNTASTNASTAITNAASAQSTANTANTAAGTAQSGATAANANANSALTQLLAIPVQTVVPNLMAGASSVTIGNAGSGGSATNPSGSVSTPLSCTGTQTIGSTASVMVASATFSLVGSGTQGNAQISIGGQQMQYVGNPVQLSSATEFIQFFILWNPPVGTSQTVTATAYGILGAGIGSVSFESASYIGATTVSTLITNSGTGTALTLSVPAAIAGTMAVAAFSAGDVITKATTALSGYTKTSRGNTTVQVNSTQYGYQSLVFGDTTGGSGGVTFGATCGNSSAIWVGAGVILSAASVIGSGFRVTRTSTSPLPAASGNNILSGSFFSTTPTITSDYSYNSATTNTLTVNNAGWYSVTISLLTTTSYTSFMLGPLLYQNGALAQSGMRQYMSSGQSWVLQSTFSIYCNAGDTLQPGYFSGVAFATTWTGESTGAQCYWEVALMNRSLL